MRRTPAKAASRPARCRDCPAFPESVWTSLDAQGHDVLDKNRMLGALTQDGVALFEGCNLRIPDLDAIFDEAEAE